jgi:DNA-binding response OmpR family regulator
MPASSGWRQLLSLEGYTVETAPDGAAALAAALAERPAVLIASQSIFHMGGIKLCRRIRASAELRSVQLILTGADLFPLADGALCDDFWKSRLPSSRYDADAPPA